MNLSGQYKYEDLQRIRGFRLIDDDFMSKCFEDNIECTELVLHIVLGTENLKVEQAKTQHFIKNLQGRSIILDVYAIDNTGKRYNIEIQKTDRGAGAKRARYHSSLIDANIIEPGDKLENLLETYVIFITENDVLGKGLPIYHADRVIKETGDDFNDESHIIYVNGACQSNSPLGILMHDFFCTNPDDITYSVLAERVRYFKENEKGVAAMCKVMEDMRNEAALAARLEERKNVANRLLQKSGMPLEEIAEITQLTLEEVQALAVKRDA